MKLQVAVLTLSSLFFVQGRFEERKKFHDWLCQEIPALKTCSEPFTMPTYEKELEHYHRRRVREDDLVTDEDYEYYLWMKYLHEKMQKFLQEENLSYPTRRRYRRPFPFFGGWGYPRFGDFGYPGFGGFGGFGYPMIGFGGTGFPRYGLSGLFNLGIGSGVGVSTPIGNVDVILQKFGLTIG